MESTHNPPQIFRLLLLKGRLEDRHLDMLWSAVTWRVRHPTRHDTPLLPRRNLACCNQHESVDHLIYETVKKLAPLLSRPQVPPPHLPRVGITKRLNVTSTVT